MQIELKVTHTLSPEVLDFLMQLSKGFGATTSPDQKITKKEEVSKPEPVKQETTDDSEEITLFQVRAVANEVAKQEGKREKVNALVKEYGVNSLPKIDPAHYKDFLQKVKNL